MLSDIAVMKLPNGTVEIEKEAFAGSGIKCVILPNFRTRIGENAFANCMALKLVEMTENVTSIADNVFGNSPLSGITAPSGSYAETWAKEHHISFTQ